MIGNEASPNRQTTLGALRPKSESQMARAEAMATLGLDWRKIDGLLRLCSPERHAGSQLAVKATAYLKDLRSGWTACESDGSWLEKHRFTEKPAIEPDAELPDDPINDLWAAG